MRILVNSIIAILVISHPVFSPLTRPFAEYVTEMARQSLSAMVQHEVKRQWGELWH